VVDVVGALQLALALGLLSAGIAKLLTRENRDTLVSSLGLPAVVRARWWVTSLEIALAASLLANLAPPIPAFAASTVLLVFTAVLLVAIRNGVGLPCGCFGSFDGLQVGTVAVARNLGLLASALFIAAYPVPAGVILFSPARIIIAVAISIFATLLYGFASTVDRDLRTVTERREQVVP
jgi:uncharacterized membrane protein YphA (DoxX/SURF4 family)